jgi:hypothetical protein
MFQTSTRLKWMALVGCVALASCMPASRVTRAPEARAPMMVTLSPESIRALAQHSAHAQNWAPASQGVAAPHGTVALHGAPVYARLNGVVMECQAGRDNQRNPPDESRSGLYRAVAGFVAGAVITPALAAVSPGMGSAWVEVLAQWQRTGARGGDRQGLWCQPVSR